MNFKERLHFLLKRACWFLIFFVSLKNLSAQKTDKVYLKNGDILTGEIKSMELAILNFNMDGPGVINIKWEKVIGLKSDKTFEIMLRWGELVVDKPDSLFFTRHHFTIDDIVEMTTIKDKFLRRLSGDISIGFNYTKSSKILQFNLGGTLTYRIPKLEINLVANSFITNKIGDSLLTKKQDISLNVTKYLSHHLFFISQLAWQQNTELGLNNRYLFSSGLGATLISDNHNRLMTAAGLSVNKEQSLDSAKFLTNLDALGTIQYRRFYYSTPKLSITTGFNVYPGLTDWGRVRLEFNLKTSIEVFTDFLIGLSLYDNYDSRPPQGALSTNDFGVNFTVSYKFGK